jgi:hypothetical protein
MSKLITVSAALVLKSPFRNKSMQCQYQYHIVTPAQAYPVEQLSFMVSLSNHSFYFNEPFDKLRVSGLNTGFPLSRE